MTFIFLSEFIFLLGLAVGSFLNVLSDRLPKGENPFRGRSHCDHCRKNLSPIDLIPVLSHLSLRGRCRYCHKKLSIQYPLIELTSGVMFVSLYWYLDKTMNLNPTLLLSFLSLIIIFSSLLVIFIADIKYQIIPDQMVLTSSFGALFYLLTLARFSHIALYENILSAIGSAGFFLAIYLLTKGRGMGFGDVKLAFPLGLWLGFPKVVVAFYVSFLTGAIVSIILILTRKKRFRERIAFGPFMIWGAVISFFFGEQLIQWYLSFFH